jgi:hypothetical protein
MVRTGLVWLRDNWRSLVNAAMNLPVPYNAGRLSCGYTIGGLSSSAQFHTVSYSKDGRFWPVDLCCAVVRSKSASLRLVSMRNGTFCLSNNSDVEVIGSLLLVHCVLLLHAVSSFLSLSLSLSCFCTREMFVA